MQSDFVLFSICYDCTVCQKLKMEPKVALRYIDRQGFIERGGWNSTPPPPPRNLEIKYGCYCFVTGIKQQSCTRLCQKQSERI